MLDFKYDALNERTMETINKFAHLPEGARFCGQLDNSYFFRVPERECGVIETTFDGEKNTVSEDMITVTLDSDEITISDIITNGWRQYREEDTTYGLVVEYTTDHITNRKYSIVTKDEGTFLQLTVSKVNKSMGLHDSFGGEKGNGFNEIEYELHYSAKVPDDYKLSDGLDRIQFNAKKLVK